MCYLERNTNQCAMRQACVFPIAGRLACHTVHVRMYVIVNASKPTSQYNQAKAYDCAMESEAVVHASCVEVTSFIRRYHAYQDVWQPRVEIFVCPLYANLSNLSSANFCLSIIRELICIGRYATPYFFKCPHSGLSGCPHLRGFTLNMLST